jgi:hypothetical protein
MVFYAESLPSLPNAYSSALVKGSTVLDIFSRTEPGTRPPFVILLDEGASGVRGSLWLDVVHLALTAATLLGSIFWKGDEGRATSPPYMALATLVCLLPAAFARSLTDPGRVLSALTALVTGNLVLWLRPDEGGRDRAVSLRFCSGCVFLVGASIPLPSASVQSTAMALGLVGVAVGSVTERAGPEAIEVAFRTRGRWLAGILTLALLLSAHFVSTANWWGVPREHLVLGTKLRVPLECSSLAAEGPAIACVSRRNNASSVGDLAERAAFYPSLGPSKRSAAHFVALTFAVAAVGSAVATIQAGAPGDGYHLLHHRYRGISVATWVEGVVPAFLATLWRVEALELVRTRSDSTVTALLVSTVFLLGALAAMLRAQEAPVDAQGVADPEIGVSYSPEKWKGVAAIGGGLAVSLAGMGAILSVAAREFPSTDAALVLAGLVAVGWMWTNAYRGPWGREARVSRRFIGRVIGSLVLRSLVGWAIVLSWREA